MNLFCILSSRKKQTLPHKDPKSQHFPTRHPIHHDSRLRHQLNDTTSLLDLPLGVAAEVSRAHNDGDVREAALAQDLGVSEREQVDDGRSVGLLSAQVGLARLGGDERPELHRRVQISPNCPPIA